MIDRKEFKTKLEQKTTTELSEYGAVIDCLLNNHRRELRKLEIKSEEIQKEIYKRGLNKC